MNSMTLDLLNPKMVQTMGLRIWAYIVCFEIKSSIIRFIFCKHGFHSVMPSGEEYWQNSKGIHLHTYYVRCKYCDTIFFPSQYQKEMYKRIQESKTQTIKNLFAKRVNDVE